MTRTLWLLVVMAGCAGTNKSANPETPKDEAVAKDAAPDPEPEPAPVADPDTPTPASLYASCRDRVEGPEADGECETDADCKTAGCGGEVCTTVAEAANVMTTCDAKLCFSVLETCGCVEGRCSWALKDAIPEGQKLPMKPGTLPPGNALPPTAPAPAPEEPPAEE